MTQRIIVSVALIMLAASVVSAQTVIPGGDVSGTWNLAGSPYRLGKQRLVALAKKPGNS